MNQLVCVNDPNDPTAGVEGTTWVYTYDRGGNILNKSAYGYTTAAVSSPVNQWSYAYEDANWKDKLTKFNGTAIENNTYCGSFIAYLLKDIVFMDNDLLKEHSRNEVFTRLLSSPQYVNPDLLSEGEDYLVDFLDKRFLFYTDKVRRK